jgi:hypothetical protein
LETNYWGETYTIKQLRARKLVKDNLRIVKNFGRFYNIPKFMEIGNNLARSIIEAGEMDILRNKPGLQITLTGIYKDIDKVYKKLTSKSERRKLQKTLKNQAKKYRAKTINENSILELDRSINGFGADHVVVADTFQSQDASTLVSTYAPEAIYEVGEILEEEDSLHQEEGYNGQATSNA